VIQTRREVLQEVLDRMDAATRGDMEDGYILVAEMLAEEDIRDEG
jgi:hypothetical protein